MDEIKCLCPVCGMPFYGRWFTFPIGDELGFRQCTGDPKHIYFITEVGSDLKEIIRNRAERISKRNILPVDPKEIEKLIWHKVGVPISEAGVTQICDKYLDLINAIRAEEAIIKSQIDFIGRHQELDKI